MTLPVLTGGIDLSVGAIVAITAVDRVGVGEMPAYSAFQSRWSFMIFYRRRIRFADRHADRGIQHAAVGRCAWDRCFLARGIASIISAKAQTFPENNNFDFIAQKITIIDNPKISYDLYINVGVITADWCSVVIFGYLSLLHTRTGRTIYAIGGSRSSAELMGLPGQAHAVHHLL